MDKNELEQFLDIWEKQLSNAVSKQRTLVADLKASLMIANRNPKRGVIMGDYQWAVRHLRWIQGKLAGIREVKSSLEDGFTLPTFQIDESLPQYQKQYQSAWRQRVLSGGEELG